MWVDETVLNVKGGDGGDGSVAFRREKYMAHGGPCGGDGGKGGDVILRADRNAKTLLDFSRRPHQKGDRGRHGEGGRKKGVDGESVVLPTPLGTQVFDAETGAMLTDLMQHGQTFLAAYGGDGGRGNTRFVSSTRQTPRFAERGAKGGERRLRLSLKVLADVAFIGLPNAGKSTLIASISAAKPKIADYPFTTLLPNLGAVVLDPENQFVAGDIPGLIRGAHKGAGLGHQFLKHIERAPVFIHLLDGSTASYVSLWRSFMTLNRELKMWNPELLDRPQLVAINKMDAATGNEEAQAAIDAFEARLQARGCEVFRIAAATREGLEPLLWRTMELVKDEREANAEAAQAGAQDVYVEHFEAHAPFEIKEIARYADGMSEWDIKGGAMENLVKRFDMENFEAVRYVHHIWERQGIIENLRNAGVKPGDMVHIGDVAFGFEE